MSIPSPNLSTPAPTTTSSGSVIDPVILGQSAILESSPVFQAERLATQQLVRPPWWAPLPSPPPPPPPPAPSISLSGPSRRSDWVHGCILCPHRGFDRTSKVQDHVMREHPGYGEENWKELLDYQRERKWRN